MVQLNLAKFRRLSVHQSCPHNPVYLAPSTMLSVVTTLHMSVWHSPSIEYELEAAFVQ